MLSDTVGHMSDNKEEKIKTNWIDLIRRYKDDGFPVVDITLQDGSFYKQALAEVKINKGYMSFKCGIFRIKITNEEIKEVAI